MLKIRSKYLMILQFMWHTPNINDTMSHDSWIFHPFKYIIMFVLRIIFTNENHIISKTLRIASDLRFKFSRLPLTFPTCITSYAHMDMMFLYLILEIPWHSTNLLLILRRKLHCIQNKFEEHLFELWACKIFEIILQMSDRFTSGLILGLQPANERRRYKVTPSLIGWVQA